MNKGILYCIIIILGILLIGCSGIETSKKTIIHFKNKQVIQVGESIPLTEYNYKNYKAFKSCDYGCKNCIVNMDNINYIETK